MNDTIVTIVGNLVADPVRRDLSTGRTNVSLRVASTERRWSAEEGRKVDGRTSFYSVSCWGYLAEHVAQSLKKGERVIVSGKLSVREYTDAKDQPRISVDIDARAVGPDLTFGTTEFTRFSRSLATPSADDCAQWTAGPAELDGVVYDENGVPLPDEPPTALGA